MTLREKKDYYSSRIEREIAPGLSTFQKIMLYLDFRIERARSHITFLDYIQYRFYWRNHRGRERFITTRRASEIIKTCNVWESCLAKFGNKVAFNQRFDKYLRRRWLDTTTCTLEEFKAFAGSLDRFFIKPVDKSYGIGTGIINTSEIKDYVSLFEDLKKSETLAEELIDQHPELAAFNESSVNTMRVVTIRCADDTVKIMVGVLRVGRAGKVADNFHHHGICALIDVETGIVKTEGFDKDNSRFVLHPDSKKPIVGFRVPCWNAILDMVKEAARVVPEVRFVGWDVTVDAKGNVLIVEGNSTPMHDVTQIPDQIGKWADYEPIIEELKNMKRK